MNPIKKNPLGRGLDSLIPRSEPAPEPHGGASVSDRLLDIDITDISPNDKQPRYDFDKDALAALTESVKEKGVIQPVVVVRKGESFMLISGERRWRAAGLAGLRKIPAVVAEVTTENERLELALIENTQRDDLKPLELAKAYKELIDKAGYRQEDVARIAGRSRSAVANTLRLLELPPEIYKALDSREITEGHARVFLSIDKEYCTELLNLVITRSLSVRETEELAKKMQANGPKPLPRSKEADPNMLSIAKEMEDFFGSKVTLKPKGKKGVIEITYSSEDELDKIVNKLRRDI